MPGYLLPLFAMAFCSTAWWLFTFWRLTGRLRKYHPELYKKLGRPEISTRPVSWQEQKAINSTLVFLFKKHYLSYPDAELVRSAGRARNILLLTFSLMALLFASVGQFLFEDATTNSSEAAVSQFATSPGTTSSEEGVERQFAAEARRLYQAGRYDEVIDLLAVYLSDPQADANAWYYRALAHEKLGNNAAALSDFQQVVRYAPDHFNSYQHIDYLYALESRWEEIIPWWDNYLTVMPDDDAAHLERAGTFFRMGNFAEALTGAQRACELGNNEACMRAEQLRNN